MIKKYVDRLIRLQIRLSESLTKKLFLTLQSLKKEVTNANTAPMSSKYNSFCGSLSNTYQALHHGYYRYYSKYSGKYSSISNKKRANKNSLKRLLCFVSTMLTKNILTQTNKTSKNCLNFPKSLIDAKFRTIGRKMNEYSSFIITFKFTPLAFKFRPCLQLWLGLQNENDQKQP